MYENIILNSGNVLNYFTSVGNMSEGTERELLINDLLRYYLEEEEMDTVLLLLANESGENYKMAYALMLLNHDEVSEAEDVVESLPVNSDETESFTDYFNILVYAKENELTLAELPENKISELEDIAENRTIGGYSGQVILSNYYDQEFLSILETDTSIEYRSKKDKDLTINISRNLLEIKPNPVSEQINVFYKLYGEVPFTFNILSLDGKEWSSAVVDKSSGVLSIDAETLPLGVYILQATDNLEMMEVHKFIKK